MKPHPGYRPSTQTRLAQLVRTVNATLVEPSEAEVRKGGEAG